MKLKLWNKETIKALDDVARFLLDYSLIIYLVLLTIGLTIRAVS